MSPCTECEAPTSRRNGLCELHYRRSLRGIPLDAPLRTSSRGLSLSEFMDAHLDKSGGANACWEWMGNRDVEGYGIGSWSSIRLRASRAMWEVANGRSIPAGLLVRHKCDNPPCCNPAHLELGTDLDNMRDRIERAPETLVLSSSFRRHSPETVAAIRAEYAEGSPQAHLVQKYGVSRSQVSRIVRHETWVLA